MSVALPAIADFTYQASATRVVFGAGSLCSLRSEIERLGRSRVLLITTAGRRDDTRAITELLGALCVAHFGDATMHTPADVTQRACEAARAANADLLLTFGGGSTIGLAKAMALQLDLPIVAIPTTYSGSEMTPVFGITEQGVKRTGRDDRVLPRTAIYDVDLTLGLPVEVSVASGLNAIAHAAEGLYARDGSPLTSLMAEEGIRALASGLVALRARADDLAARTACLYGAWLCGAVLGSVGMALHHKLCHTLGGSFNLPHAQTHAALLPHSIAHNAAHAPEAMALLCRALGVTHDAGGALHRLNLTLGITTALKDLGLQQADLARAADLAVQNPYWNPRPIERGPILALLENAWSGAVPVALDPAALSKEARA
ncbi:maleylacetate reductase [Panacagrimonas perspica]|uniref:Maleylacetate reductase n=1 Tax=Panacagrimonas perspica TaxID=381431 RepID=A0A4R7P566_9GAMM|nr:maleylacetate reductase [Panacagrimonas perspica]TDU28549.1 maleylacetate reductase [Panacagrimonas perspica]THD01495.1 maleylacetate reductase [Panacagrimonas perspica]